MKKLLALTLMLFLVNINLRAQDSTLSPIIFIVDASGSMWGQIDGEVKMQIAKDVLEALIDSLPATQATGLVAYGHRQKGDCKDVEYLVAADSKDKKQFQEKLRTLKPLGKTPLAYSAKLVIDRLRESKTKATVILLTDGVETCDGDLCELVKAAKAEGIEFKMHIVGFDLKPEEKAALKCAAEAGGGNYLDASNAEELSAVLNNTTYQTVDDPAPNCFLTASKNGELIDGYIKIFEKTSGEEIRPNYRTYSDTAKIPLSPGTYKFEVSVLGFKHGLGKVSQEVVIAEKKDSIHRIDISFDAGSVVVKILNNGDFWDSTVKITEKGDTKGITQGRSYDRSITFELEAGNYDVHILPLRIKGIEVKQKQTFSVKANETDTVRFDIQSGIAMIGATSNSKLVDAMVSISSIDPVKNIVGGRTYTSDNSNPKSFILLPGDYKIKIKGLSKEVKGMQKEAVITIPPKGEVKKIFDF